MLRFRSDYDFFKYQIDNAQIDEELKRIGKSLNPSDAKNLQQM